ASDLGPQIDFLPGSSGFPEFAPSVTAAFVRRVPPLHPETVNYSMIDLCPATLGLVLNPGGGSLDSLNGTPPTAEVIDTGGGPFVARVFPSAGGSIDVGLTDCLASSTTIVTETSTTSTTTTTSTSTTLPPIVTTLDPNAPGGFLEVLNRVNFGQPGP